MYVIKSQETKGAKNQNSVEMNEMITDPKVRLISEDGEQLGMMSGEDAYQLALDKKMDLVKIAPQANPPVCKIMDYGKHRYAMKRKKKKRRKSKRRFKLRKCV